MKRVREIVCEPDCGKLSLSRVVALILFGVGIAAYVYHTFVLHQRADLPSNLTWAAVAMYGANRLSNMFRPPATG